ncbi:MAG TPA: hypothetical protein VM093_07440 [Aeromicrobium sp.]|nr:hypothetical protein [Aeromicrobium sp.]
MADADDSIGSLGQETLKLLRVMAAERLRAQDPAADDAEPTAQPAAEPTHVCTTSWCPICQVVGYVQDHPELVEQVTETVADAAVQVGRIVRDFLDKTIPPEVPKTEQ